MHWRASWKRMQKSYYWNATQRTTKYASKRSQKASKNNFRRVPGSDAHQRRRTWLWLKVRWRKISLRYILQENLRKRKRNDRWDIGKPIALGMYQPSRHGQGEIWAALQRLGIKHQAKRDRSHFDPWRCCLFWSGSRLWADGYDELAQLHCWWHYPCHRKQPDWIHDCAKQRKVQCLFFWFSKSFWCAYFPCQRRLNGRCSLRIQSCSCFQTEIQQRRSYRFDRL